MPIGRTILIGPPRDSAGQRDHWVELETRTVTAGSTGYPVETWASLGGVFMSRAEVRADERQVAGAGSAFIETVWQGPYRADSDPELVDVPTTIRINDRGKIFNVRAASLIGRRRAIEYLTLAKAGA